MAGLRQAAKSGLDRIFLQSIRAAADELQLGAARNKAADVADTALKQARTELNGRWQTLEAAFSPVRALMQQGWTSPSQATARLQAARRCANQVAALLTSQDIEAVQDRLDTELAEANVALVNACSAWRESAGEYLEALADHPPALPEDGAQKLAGKVKSWVESYGNRRVKQVATPAELG